MNQRCIIQRWFEISNVSDNADLESALYDTSSVWYSADSELVLYPTTMVSVFKGMFFPNNFSFEAMRAVGYSADSELVLYPTMLIQN
jgi:hypothetical protein